MPGYFYRLRTTCKWAKSHAHDRTDFAGAKPQGGDRQGADHRWGGHPHILEGEGLCAGQQVAPTVGTRGALKTLKHSIDWLTTRN